MNGDKFTSIYEKMKEAGRPQALQNAENINRERISEVECKVAMSRVVSKVAQQSASSKDTFESILGVI
jgi:hypothetical protein